MGQHLRTSSTFSMASSLRDERAKRREERANAERNVGNALSVGLSGTVSRSASPLASALIDVASPAALQVLTPTTNTNVPHTFTPTTPNMNVPHSSTRTTITVTPTPNEPLAAAPTSFLSNTASSPRVRVRASGALPPHAPPVHTIAAPIQEHTTPTQLPFLPERARAELTPVQKEIVCLFSRRRNTVLSWAEEGHGKGVPLDSEKQTRAKFGSVACRLLGEAMPQQQRGSAQALSERNYAAMNVFFMLCAYTLTQRKRGGVAGARRGEKHRQRLLGGVLKWLDGGEALPPAFRALAHPAADSPVVDEGVLPISKQRLINRLVRCGKPKALSKAAKYVQGSTRARYTQLLSNKVRKVFAYPPTPRLPDVPNQRRGRGADAVLTTLTAGDKKLVKSVIGSMVNDGSAPDMGGWTAALFLVVMESKVAFDRYCLLLALILHGKITNPLTRHILTAGALNMQHTNGKDRSAVAINFHMKVVEKFITAKIGKSRIAAPLRPVQMGIAVSAGVERVFNTFIAVAQDPQNIVIKSDISKAFPSAKRPHTMKEILRIPAFAPMFEYVQWVFQTDALVLHRDKYGTVDDLFVSTRGFFQGRPLATPWFGAAVKPLYERAAQKHPDTVTTKALVDDCFFGGPLVDTIESFVEYRNALRDSSAGFILNEKFSILCSEAIAASPATKTLLDLHNIPLSVLNTTSIEVGGLTLYRGTRDNSRGERAAKEHAAKIQAKTDAFFEALDKSDTIDTQVKYHLLNRTQIPKMMFLTRGTRPDLMEQILKRHTHNVHSSFLKSVSAPQFLLNDEPVVELLGAPLRCGGFGLTDLSKISSIARFSSIAASAEDIVSLLQSYPNGTDMLEVEVCEWLKNFAHILKPRVMKRFKKHVEHTSTIGVSGFDCFAKLSDLVLFSRRTRPATQTHLFWQYFSGFNSDLSPSDITIQTKGLQSYLSHLFYFDEMYRSTIKPYKDKIPKSPSDFEVKRMALLNANTTTNTHTFLTDKSLDISNGAFSYAVHMRAQIRMPSDSYLNDEVTHCLCGQPLNSSPLTNGAPAMFTFQNHFLCCQRSNKNTKSARHDQCQRLMNVNAVSIGANVVSEVFTDTTVAEGEDRIKPDALYWLPRSSGATRHWVDTSIVHPLCGSYIKAEASTRGATLRTADRRKHRKYAEIEKQNAGRFHPFSLSAFAGLGVGLKKFITILHSEWRRLHKSSGIANFLVARLKRDLCGEVLEGNLAIFQRMRFLSALRIQLAHSVDAFKEYLSARPRSLVPSSAEIYSVHRLSLPSRVLAAM